MHLLWMIIIGFVVGLLARFIMPGKDPGGFLVTSALGIAGSLLASFIGRSAGWYTDGQSASFLAAIIGAVILLLVYRMLRGGSKASARSR